MELALINHDDESDVASGPVEGDVPIPTTPESQKYRNDGKLITLSEKSRDSSRVAGEKLSAKDHFDTRLADIIIESSSQERDAAIAEEKIRQKQVQVGQLSGSPLRNIETSEYIYPPAPHPNPNWDGSN